MKLEDVKEDGVYNAQMVTGGGPYQVSRINGEWSLTDGTGWSAKISSDLTVPAAMYAQEIKSVEKVKQ